MNTVGKIRILRELVRIGGRAVCMRAPSLAVRSAGLAVWALSLCRADSVSASPSIPSLFEVLANVRTAMNYDRLSDYRDGLVAEYVLKEAGSETTIRHTFEPTGRWVVVVEGYYTAITGFDGETGWSVDWSNAPLAYDPGDPEFEQTRLDASLFVGQWLDADSKITLAVVDRASTEAIVVLSARVDDGSIERWLTIDRASWLPRLICDPGKIDRPAFRFEDFREVLGFRFPHRVCEPAASDRGCNGRVLELRSIKPVEHASSDPYVMATHWRNDTRFAKTVKSKLRVKIGGNEDRHLLVPVRLDGFGLAWLILDSGASHSMVDEYVAKKLDMRAVEGLQAKMGKDPSPQDFCRLPGVSIGPMTIPKLIGLRTDLAFISVVNDELVSAIVGYDVLCRAVIELNIRKRTLRIHDPTEYERDDVEWVPITFNNRLPRIPCEFEGSHRGFFLVDTGSIHPVEFTSAAVKHFGLLDDRKTRRTKSANVRGEVTTVRSGTLEWFKIGSQRVSEVQDVIFGLASNEQYSENSNAGAIGLGLLKGFKVIFDYPHKRVAFIRLPGHEEAGCSTQQGDSEGG